MKRLIPGIFACVLVMLHVQSADAQMSSRSRLPREVWIASITLMLEFGSEYDTVGNTVEERITHMLARMEAAAAYNPDIICLSEVFAHTGLQGLPPLADRAETPPGPITSRFASFAREHNCWVICPVYTKRNGRVYNAAVLIDRNGRIAGEYDKIRPTEGEIEHGITPGPLDPPVFETDFGKIGMMICFDANWPEDWRKLKDKGAEIVFWPSAFAGGKIINSLALNFGYYIVACTRHQPARIVDMTGEDIASNGRLQSWFVAPVNLDKKVFHWDFQDDEFRAIQEKYGDKIGYQIAHPEGWFLLESRSPDISIDNIMKEFGLVTYDQYIVRATKAQENARR